MKFTAERSAFLKILNHVENVVEKRQTIPILANVKIDVINDLSGENITVRATDMDIEVVETAPVKVQEEGSITTSAHKLLDIMRKLPEGTEVNFELDEKTSLLKITSGRAKFSLATLPGAEFPSISEGNMPVNFTLTSAQMQGLFDRTVFAVSTEETRYYLNGIYMHKKGEGNDAFLRTAATDGHRLATAEIALPAGAEKLEGVIISRKTVGEVQKLAAELQEDIKISVSDVKVRFCIAGVTLTAKLIDGTYPDYEKVIPAGNDKVAEVDADVLASAVDRVAVISEKTKGVHIHLTKDALRISANASEEGSAEDEVEADYDSDDLDIGFNSRYVLDILNQCKGARVKLSMLDSSSPVTVHDLSDSSVTYVIMPMRV